MNCGASALYTGSLRLLHATSCNIWEHISHLIPNVITQENMFVNNKLKMLSVVASAKAQKTAAQIGVQLDIIYFHYEHVYM